MNKKIIGMIFMFLVSTFILDCISESPGPNNIIPVWTKIFDKALSLNSANQTSDKGYIIISNVEFLQSPEGIYQDDVWLIKTIVMAMNNGIRHLGDQKIKTSAVL